MFICCAIITLAVVSFRYAEAQEIVVPLATPVVTSVVSPQGGQDGEIKAGRTTINFEDQLVESGVQRPDLFYLLQKKDLNYKRLIKLREDFLPELKRDSSHLSRGSAD